MFVIFVAQDAAGLMDPVNGWLVACDVDAREGRGTIQFTRLREEARRFESIDDAWDYYRRESTVCPVRPDGKPNRPLTAYTVTILPEDAA